MSDSQPSSAKQQAWISGLQQGSETALQAIFNQYYKYLLVTAYNIIGDKEKAKDLVQDVFFELWKKREQHQIQNLKAYLRRAVVNKGLNYLKMYKRFDWGEEKMNLQLAAQEASAQKLLETSDLQSIINQTIQQLPDKCKTVFVLSRFEKFSHKEIAAQLNISTKTIENQITKALKSIRAAINEYNELGIFVLLTFFQ